jgi:phosphohistidine phosphatase
LPAVATLLDLVRHGEALPAATGGDAERVLSPRGIGEVALLARRLSRLGPPPARVFTSPLLRARQTAALVLSGYSEAPEAVVADALRPDEEPADVVAWLAGATPESGHLMLVGHMPLLGDLTGFLTDGSSHGMRPAELVRLEFDYGVARREGRVVLVLAPGATE